MQSSSIMNERRHSADDRGPDPEVTVEVKTAQLEQYLRSIQETLSKHEEDNKLVPILSRKLDLCMLDVDVIRDYFYQQKSQIAEQNTISHANTIQFLRAELEALKIVTRRIDLHQATDAMVFCQIKELQREVRMMKKDREMRGSGVEKSERKKMKEKKDKKTSLIHIDAANSLKKVENAKGLELGASGQDGYQMEIPFFDSHAKLSQMSFNSSLSALNTAAISISGTTADIATGIVAKAIGSDILSSSGRLDSSKSVSIKKVGSKKVTYTDQNRDEDSSSDGDDDLGNKSPNKSYSSKWKSRKISMLTRSRRRNTTIVGDSNSDSSDNENGPGYNSEFDELARGMDKHQTAITSIEQYLVILKEKQIADMIRDELAEVANLKKKRLKKITNGAEVLSNLLKRRKLNGVRLLFLRWNSKVFHKIMIIPKGAPSVDHNSNSSLLEESNKKGYGNRNKQELKERKRKGKEEVVDWKGREKKYEKDLMIVDDVNRPRMITYEDKLINIASSVTRVNWVVVVLRPRFAFWKARTLILREAEYQDERQTEIRDIAEALKSAQMSKIRPIARGWFLLSYPELRKYYQRWRRCTVWLRLKIGIHIEGAIDSSLIEISTEIFADLKSEEYQGSLVKFTNLLMDLITQPEVTSDNDAHQFVIRMLFKTTSLRISYTDSKAEERQDSFSSDVEKMSRTQLEQRDRMQNLTDFVNRMDKKIIESKKTADIMFDEYKIDVTKFVDNSVGNAAEILNFKQAAMLTKLRDMTTKLDFWGVLAQETEERLIRTEFKLQKLLVSYGEQLTQLVALENGHLDYMKERVIWNKDMKNVSLTANTTQEKFIEFNRWRIGYETTVRSEINVLKGSSNTLSELIVQINVRDEREKEGMKKLEERMMILEQVLQVISPVVPTARELISICSEFESDVLHLNKSQSIRNINVNMILDIAISEKIIRFATRLAVQIAATANLAVLCVTISEPSMKTGINNNNPSGTNIEEEVAIRRDQLIREFHSQFIMILKDESSTDPGISRCEARVVFYHRFMSALELSMSIHAYMVVEIPAAISIGRSNGSSKNNSNTYSNTNGTTMYSGSYNMNNSGRRPQSAMVLSGGKQSQSEKLLTTAMSNNIITSLSNETGNNKNNDSSASCLTCERPLKDRFGLNRRKQNPSLLSLPLLLSAFEEEMSVLSLRKENEKNNKLALQSILKAKASRSAFLGDTWRENDGTLPNEMNSEPTAENMLSFRSIVGVGKGSQVSFDDTNNNDTDDNGDKSESIRRKSTGIHSMLDRSQSSSSLQ